MGLRLKGFVAPVVLAGIMVFAFHAGEAHASPATYAIDDVYDNVNGSWFSGAPTLTQGQSYDLTIVGSGDAGDLPPEEFVSEGAFINFGGVGTDWSTFPDAPVVYGSVLGLPVLDFENKTYTLNGTFDVPLAAPTGPGEALVWLDSSFLFPPDEGSDLYQYCFEKHGREFCFDREPLATELFDINVNPGQEKTDVVPEPATLALMSLGMTGLFFEKRKKRS